VQRRVLSVYEAPRKPVHQKASRLAKHNWSSTHPVGVYPALRRYSLGLERWDGWTGRRGKAVEVNRGVCGERGIDTARERQREEERWWIHALYFAPFCRTATSPRRVRDSRSRGGGEPGNHVFYSPAGLPHWSSSSSSSSCRCCYSRKLKQDRSYFCATMAGSRRGVVAELSFAKRGQSTPLTAISLSRDQRHAVVGGHGIMKVSACVIYLFAGRVSVIALLR